MITDRSITVSKKGVSVTITFKYDNATARAMKIANTFVTTLLDQFIGKLDMLSCGYWMATVAPRETEITKVANQETEL